MITRDLFELAHLDVLGLLDDSERREFEQAFREAPPAVQAQIRREQLRQADIEDWLPKVEPAPGLKHGVMQAVQQAIEAVRAGRAREHVALKLGPFALALQRNVSPLWRAAAVGFATATIGLSVAALRLNGYVGQVDQTIRSNGEMQAFLGAGGAGLSRVLSSPQSQSVSFLPGAAVVDAQRKEFQAGLHSAPGYGTYLVCSLPKTQGGYRLVALSDDGKSVAREIASFDPAAGQQIISIKDAIPAGTKLAILPRSAGDNLSAALLVTRA